MYDLPYVLPYDLRVNASYLRMEVVQNTFLSQHRGVEQAQYVHFATPGKIDGSVNIEEELDDLSS